MNRIIKFRLWDNKKKKMFFPSNNIIYDNDPEYGWPMMSQMFEIKNNSNWICEQSNQLSDDCEIMQFSNCKDKMRLKYTKEIFY